MALDNHLNKVEHWLNLAFEDKTVTDKWYFFGFANTLDDEFKSHLSNDNINDIETMKELKDRINDVMLKKIPTESTVEHFIGAWYVLIETFTNQPNEVRSSQNFQENFIMVSKAGWQPRKVG